MQNLAMSYGIGSIGKLLRLAVEPVEGPPDSLELLRSIYAGLSEKEIDEIEKITLDRSNWSTNRSLE